MKRMKFFLLIVFFGGISINTFADSNYIQFEDITKEKKKVTKYPNGVSYSISLYSAPNDLYLSPQSVHRVTYHNLRNRAYVFLGIGQSSKIKNSGFYWVSNDTIRITDTEFRMIQLGGGFSFSPFQKDIFKNTLSGYSELAIQSYLGQNSSLSINGYFLSFGFDYVKQINEKLRIIPSAGLRLEYLPFAYVEGKTGTLTNPIFGIAVQTGVSIRYLF